jgi:hypothetical protein
MDVRVVAGADVCGAVRLSILGVAGALKEMTRRFSAEFAVRPFIMQDAEGHWRSCWRGPRTRTSTSGDG